MLVLVLVLLPGQGLRPGLEPRLALALVPEQALVQELLQPVQARRRRQALQALAWQRPALRPLVPVQLAPVLQLLLPRQLRPGLVPPLALPIRQALPVLLARRQALPAQQALPPRSLAKQIQR